MKTSIKALAVGLLLTATAAFAQHKVAGKPLVAPNADGGYIYLMPLNTGNRCPINFGDAFADDSTLPIPRHGCYTFDKDDVVILTDDKQGYVIPRKAFHPFQEG